jgi:DNA-binding IclR family transcriptional regulator
LRTPSVVVSWAYGTRPLPLTVRVSATSSLLTSSVGQVFLAYLSESLGTPDHLAEVTRELHDTVAAASHELGYLS